MSESTALTMIERAQVALQPAANDKQLTELAAVSKSIVTITNPDGYQQCHSARLVLKNQRIAIEKIAKSAREDATAFSKAVIAEEKRLIGLIQPEESRLETIQNAWDAARAAEKRAKEEAERARVQEIQRRLAKIQTLPELYTSAMAPDRLAEVITQLEGGLTFDYAEFAAEAEAGRQAALVALRKAHVEALERIERETAERQAREAEEARKAAERAEQERIAAEARAAEEARLAEVRRRLEEEKAEQERQAAERRAADEQRAREERERLEAERKEQERVTQIRQWIVALNGPTHLTATDSPMLIELEIRKLEDSRVDTRYGEFASEAAAARAHGIARLTELCNASHRHHAEQTRLATERAELERQQAEQAKLQAEIERREREQRETEERQHREAAEAEARRAAAETAERERQEAEAAHQREAEAQRARLKERISQLQAWEIADIVAQELGTDSATVAKRIAEITHDEWVALSMSVVGEEKAA